MRARTKRTALLVTTGLLGATVSMWGMGGSAAADDPPSAPVTTVVVSGNPTCGETQGGQIGLGYTYGARFSASLLGAIGVPTPLSGTDPAFEVTVTVTAAGTIDFTGAMPPVAAVIMKGGQPGAVVYTYVPPTTTGTGLTTPVNPSGSLANISHIDFCWDEGTPTTGEGSIAGAKYYDANTNGQRDPGEPGIGGWPVTLTGRENVSEITAADGTFDRTFTFTQPTDSVTLHLAEGVAGSPWRHTGNTVDQTSTTGTGASAALSNKEYDVTVTPGSVVGGLLFGNVCLGAGGGRTLGFWSNKNGQALIGADDLAMLSARALVGATGAAFDPTTATQVRTWLLAASATNMAYMLSVQSAAMSLNVHNGFVAGSALVEAPGTMAANAAGFATISALLAEADATLTANGLTVATGAVRTYQEALKNAFDAANNNRNFVQAGPATCPTPTFA